MRLDKYTNLKKKNHWRRFWEILQKRKIFHVNANFRCYNFNQKPAVLLAFIELKFRIS